MSNSTAILPSIRRTTADVIFDQLYADIMTLRLLPGAKVSESDIAKKNNVSRQPVREAFIQLNNKGLLTIRPQKATLVRKISIQGILNARFIRTAVEVEVIRKACKNAAEEDIKLIELNLKSQKRVARKSDSTAFHLLDYDFHHLLCNAAKAEFAYSTIADNKSLTDRLCMICLKDKKSMLELADDHSQIFDALQSRDTQRMIELTRSHVSRLDSTLKMACAEYNEYFEE